MIILVVLALQTPVLSVVRGVTFSWLTASVGRVARVGDLSVDNDVMAQLQNLKSENVRLQAELKDYRRIRTQLGTPSVEGYRSIEAAVATRPVDTFRSEFVLNKGTKDGVTVGAPVVVQGSTLIGFITELSSSTSVMRLLFHPSTSLTAEAVHPDEEERSGRGLLQGFHYTSLALKTIPRSADLRGGMPVVTVANGELIPHGLLVGNLQDIESAEGEAYQSAWLSVPYDVDEIEAVNVLVLP